MTRRAVTFTVPLPPPALHPNSRAHWRSKANAARRYRNDVYVSVREQVGMVKGFTTKVTIALLFKTRTAHQHDTDGLISWSKSLVDTLAWMKHSKDGTPRLGIIWDDGPSYLAWGTVTQEKAPKGERPCVIVTLVGA